MTSELWQRLLAPFMGFTLRALPRQAHDPSVDRRTGVPSSRGLSGCGRCRTGWDHFEIRTTQPSIWFCGHSHDVGGPCMGISPLCQTCWDELGSMEARRPFFEALLLVHRLQGMGDAEYAERMAALDRAIDVFPTLPGGA